MKGILHWDTDTTVMSVSRILSCSLQLSTASRSKSNLTLFSTKKKLLNLHLRCFWPPVGFCSVQKNTFAGIAVKDCKKYITTCLQFQFVQFAYAADAYANWTDHQCQFQEMGGAQAVEMTPKQREAVINFSLKKAVPTALCGVEQKIL